MGKIGNNTNLIVLKNTNDFNRFISKNNWLDEKDFGDICYRYGFPGNSLTVVIEKYYIDAVYRDAYYSYWAKTHFNWPRYCYRIFLFLNAHQMKEFLDQEKNEILNSDFLGTIVVRPPYSSETDHTFGRTLLNPYKMLTMTEEQGVSNPFKYLITAKYKFHLFGNIYTTRAFPFMSQDGAVMKCAETAVCELCDYAAASSEQYARILPSDIQEKLKERLPERILPSHGLYCNDISYLLGRFGFSPMIYAETDTECVEKGFTNEGSLNVRIGAAAINKKTLIEDKEIESTWDKKHVTDFKDWFHYYVESAIPVLTISSPNQEVHKHATLVIGHGMKRESIEKCKKYRLNDFPCIDTSKLYENYIVQDDNQIPYVEEQMDCFTQKKNYKLNAFIVPLDKHVFLEASAAISIFDSFIEHECELLKRAVDDIVFQCKQNESAQTEEDIKKQYEYMVRAFEISSNNPMAIRYYLANSAKYKSYRIKNGETKEDKLFYADASMPKAVWVAEISTYKLYEMGYAFAEVVIDATASNRSKINSIILLKVAHLGVFRLPHESFAAFMAKLERPDKHSNLTPMFMMFSNYINDN